VWFGLVGCYVQICPNRARYVVRMRAGLHTFQRETCPIHHGDALNELVRWANR
jgi:hypothetical protein